MVKSNLTIGFIGIGTLGRGLALALVERQYQVIAAYSRSRQSAQWLADRAPECKVYDSPQALAIAVDLVFITTPDASIARVAASIKWLPGQAVVHCCGAESLGILSSATSQGAIAGTFHPFQTFAALNEPGECAARLSGVTFGIAGQEWLPDFLSTMAYDLGGRPVFIRDEDRPLYHASAVLSCGYLVALIQSATEIWQAMGFNQEEAMQAIYPIARTTLENVNQAGVAAAVTGPLARGDVNTVRRHLEALSHRTPEAATVYAALTCASLPLAAQRGIGGAQLAELRQLIGDYCRLATTDDHQP